MPRGMVSASQKGECSLPCLSPPLLKASSQDTIAEIPRPVCISKVSDYSKQRMLTASISLQQGLEHQVHFDFNDENTWS